MAINATLSYEIGLVPLYVNAWHNNRNITENLIKYRLRLLNINNSSPQTLNNHIELTKWEINTDQQEVDRNFLGFLEYKKCCDWFVALHHELQKGNAILEQMNNTLNELGKEPNLINIGELWSVLNISSDAMLSLNMLKDIAPYEEYYKSIVEESIQDSEVDSLGLHNHTQEFVMQKQNNEYLKKEHYSDEDQEYVLTKISKRKKQKRK